MEWLFLVSGIVMIIYSLFEKYRNINKNNSFNISSEKKNEQVIKKNDLVKLDKHLEQLNFLLLNSKEEINRELFEIKNQINADRKIKNDFSSMLKQEYKKTETVDRLPEKYYKVIKLQEKGKKSEEISRELRLGIRETDLLLKMQQRKADINVKQ